jgi:hypothetical protein
MTITSHHQIFKFLLEKAIINSIFAIIFQNLIDKFITNALQNVIHITRAIRQ